MPVRESTSAPKATASPATLAAMRPSSPEAMADDTRIRATPNESFFLRHHPNQWELATEGLDGPTILPIIARHTILPGQSGIRTIKEGQHPSAAYKHAKRDDEDRGWVYLAPLDPIPAAMLPAGMPEGGYLRDLDCRDVHTTATGSYFLEAWDVPEAVPPGAVQTFRHDRAAYNRWRAWLVETGKVPQPAPAIKRALVGRVEQRLVEAETLVWPSDHLAKRKIKEATARRDQASKAEAPEVAE